MNSVVVADMSQSWTSTNPALFQVTPDGVPVAGNISATRLVAHAGAQGLTATFVPPVALDLSGLDEVRFWIVSNRVADDLPNSPFYLEFSYNNASDTSADIHRWFVPVNQANVWEQRRIGIEHDRREAVTQLTFRCLTNLPFSCTIDEMLAVHEQLLVDVESALIALLDEQVVLASVTAIPLHSDALAGTAEVVLSRSTALRVGNRVALFDATGHRETHDVGAIVDDAATATSTVQFPPGDALTRAYPSATSFVSVVVPAVVATPPLALPSVTPAIILTRLDAREDLQRTPFFTQRDSFRERQGRSVSSVRQSPRAYFVIYQVTVVGTNPAEYAAIHELLLARLTIDLGLRVNGVQLPVQITQPTELWNREISVLAPVYVRIGTRLEVEARREVTGVAHAEVGAARIDTPVDDERLVIEV
jgi:hypothetical protein